MSILEDKIFAEMTERGLIRPSWSVKVAAVDRGDRGWATVHVEVYKPRGKMPYSVWELTVYQPQKQIYWDKSKVVL